MARSFTGRGALMRRATPHAATIVELVEATKRGEGAWGRTFVESGSPGDSLPRWSPKRSPGSR